MIVPLAYWTMLLAAVVVAWRAGDRSDRWALGAIVVGNVLVAAVQSAFTLPMETIFIAILNVCLFLVLWHHAVRSQRFWPIWFASFLLAAVPLWIIANFLDPGTLRLSVSMVAAFWSIPALLILAAGSLLDQYSSSTWNSSSTTEHRP